MLRAWEAFASELPHARDLDLKLGIAAGTCMIMSANGMLDYFGQTVNTAARCQHLAGPSELVVAAGLWTEHAQSELTVVESFSRSVKGIDAPLDLVRAAITEPSAPRPSAR